MTFLLLFSIFIVAVILHEISHGWVALRLGDSTALDAGRLTLNPVKHIDPIGTIALPLFLLFMNSPFVFGWAKPVPVNAARLRHPKRDMLWVGAAGPASNFAQAILGAAVLSAFGSQMPVFAVGLVKYLVLVNLVLGVFNLLPIPPLDGSRVLTGVLPLPLARFVLSAERWGFLMVVLLLYLGVLDRIVWPVVGFLARRLGL